MYIQSEQSRVIINEIKGLEKKLAVLEKMSSFLDESGTINRVTRKQTQ